MGGMLLVGHKRMADAAGVFMQRLIDAQNRPARIPEHIAHALLQQAFYDDLRAAQQHIASPPLPRNCQIWHFLYDKQNRRIFQLFRPES